MKDVIRYSEAFKARLAGEAAGGKYRSLDEAGRRNGIRGCATPGRRKLFPIMGPELAGAAERGGRRKGKSRRRVLEKGRPTGTATVRGKRREITVRRRISPTAPPSSLALVSPASGKPSSFTLSQNHSQNRLRERGIP
jgi:hypothetical protein